MTTKLLGDFLWLYSGKTAHDSQHTGNNFHTAVKRKGFHEKISRFFNSRPILKTLKQPFPISINKLLMHELFNSNNSFILV